MPAKIRIVDAEIGRGHSFYLDGVIDALCRRGTGRLDWERLSVFELSRGLSRRAWRALEWMYRHGSSGGILGALYERLRRNTDYRHRRLTLDLLGRDLRESLGSLDPVLVSHPVLVGALKGGRDLFYQHGEMVAPGESLGPGAAVVFVPTEQVKAAFMQAGYKGEQVLVTGLCVEESLVDQASQAYHARQARISSKGPLTGLFLSSGAEPQQHIRVISSSITSSINSGGHILVLARGGGRLHREIERSRAQISATPLYCRTAAEVPAELPQWVVAVFDSRKQENELAGRIFDSIDYFVAPAHEHTNWAMGLGLPMLALTPTVGPFAPLNLDLLERAGTALRLDRVTGGGDFASGLAELQTDGRLAEMAVNGWGKHSLDGFERIATYLIEHYGAAAGD